MTTAYDAPAIYRSVQGRHIVLGLGIAVSLGWLAVYGLDGERALTDYSIAWFRLGYVWMLAWLAVTADLRNYYDPVVAYYWYFVSTTLLGTDPRLQSSIGTAFELSPGALLALLAHIAAVLAGARLATSPARAGRWTPTQPPRFRAVLEYASVWTAAALVWSLGIIASAYLFMFQWGYVPLLAPDAENIRVQAQAGLGFLVVPATLSLHVGTLLLVACSAIQRRFTWLVRGMLVVSFAVLLGYGFRALPMAVLLEAFVLTAVIHHGRIRLLPAITLVLGLFLLLGLIGFIRFGIDWGALSWDRILAIATWRTGLSDMRNLQYILEHFRDHGDLLFGKTFWVDFVALVPGPDANSGILLKEMLGLTFRGAGITPTFPGEMYANAGWAGVVFGSVALGFALRRIGYAICDRAQIGTVAVVRATILVYMLAGLSTGLVGAAIFVHIVPFLLLTVFTSWLVEMLPR